MGSLTPDAEIYYSREGAEPDRHSSKYKDPLTIKQTSRLNFRSFHPEYGSSAVIKSEFNKIPENRDIQLMTKYSQQYTAGGKTALIDMIRGSMNFRTGAWQGYHGNDLKATVDLGEQMYVSSVGLSCLQNIGSWIFLPEWVSFSVSKEGENFQPLGKVESGISPKHPEPVQHKFTVSCGREIRYIKVHAKNMGTIPEWHDGAGEPAWIFADEIVFK